MNSSEDFNQDTLSTDSERESPAVNESAGASAAAETSAPAAESAAPIVAHGESKGEAGASVESSAAPKIPSPALDDKASAERPPVRLSLIPFVAGQGADANTPPPVGASYWRAAFEKRFQLGAIAAGLAVVGVVAAASLSYKAQQDQVLVSQNNETQNLAETVKALKARLNAIDASKHEDIVELRKSVAELKNGLAAHDSTASLAQVNARAERIEHDEAAKHDEIADLRKTVAELKTGLAAAHDSSATLTQITAHADRLDHDAATHNADFAARLEKLEKRAGAPVVASLPSPQSVPLPPSAPAALTKQPAVLPPVAANVSKETTGSITPQTPIHGWVVREVHGNVAVVEGPYGFRQIGPGDTLPGAGHVERIERRGTGWTVITDRGLINSSYSGGGYRAGAYGSYGAFNGGYGPPEGEF